MANITFFFKDLVHEKQNLIIEQLKTQLQDEIKETIELNPKMTLSDVENEVIDNYINTHNVNNFFQI